MPEAEVISIGTRLEALLIEHGAEFDRLVPEHQENGTTVLAAAGNLAQGALGPILEHAATRADGL